MSVQVPLTGCWVAVPITMKVSNTLLNSCTCNYCVNGFVLCIRGQWLGCQLCGFMRMYIYTIYTIYHTLYYTIYYTDMQMYFKNVIQSGHGYVISSDGNGNSSSNGTNTKISNTTAINSSSSSNSRSSQSQSASQPQSQSELDVTPLVALFPDESVAFLRACLEVSSVACVVYIPMCMPIYTYRYLCVYMHLSIYIYTAYAHIGIWRGVREHCGCHSHRGHTPHCTGYQELHW